MKIFILALFFIAAQAKTFNVSDCILLEIDGTITLDVTSKIKDDSVKFNITDATLKQGSNCTELVLTLKDSVEFKLLFVPDNSSWTVQPSLSYDADKVFTNLNLTKPINVSTDGDDSIGIFNKNESFLCRASVEHKFKNFSEENYTFSAVATIVNLHVEAGKINDTFSPGTECDQDKTTTQTPTSTSGSTSGSTPTSPKTTPKPSFPTQSVNCSSDNVTRLLFEAQLSFDITYEKEKVNITETFEVPADAKSELNCTNNMTETISFQFNEDWVLEYIIERAKDVYWVSNITFTYTHGGKYFPGEATNKTETLRYSSSDLKAKVDGYYRCDSKSTTNLGTNVKLYTKNLKYRAFNADNKNADLKSGNVSECSADEETSSVVPIAVGAALAALVIIVLIAYLIGRKRSRKQGYESV
ncbi:lysosome-associated membrane glycoprotein 1-like [Physella acuta]|uniref:lysosome-associated membrane glycoprotein 1-like n=1 Tax=Physella acuta TaxID=109671 RepID=UPI0027DEA469|nr:lysosome-associated membrane glycoprotein 1-like [Physella acuta]XP_059139935.1 lysosome-associated membrane glycoprotein 1-like [Physella acuta]XP_059139936.1 lysosome-associated membrane glycoprotein 1-like [Physella acuta]XP_059139937.1 lysosome-associated membrane glycoprotein 1-like [Physella acuta]XP_059139938.1 lysosome-associated membrane glycoprotein 1-like [Physella acuta]